MSTVYQVANAQIIQDLVLGWCVSVDDGDFVPLTSMEMSYLRHLNNVNWAAIIPVEFKEEIKALIKKSEPDILPIVKKTVEDMAKPFDRTAYPTKEQSYDLMIQVIKTALDQHGVIDLPYVKIQKNSSELYSAFGKTHSDESKNILLTDTDVSSIIKWICQKWW